MTISIGLDPRAFPSYRAVFLPELLTEILRYHFKSSPGPLKRTAHHYAPTQVCRLWQNIALNDPWLWSIIDIEIDFSSLGKASLASESGRSTEVPIATVERLLTEVRWRLARVRQVPADLTIRFEAARDDGATRAHEVELTFSIPDMIHAFLRTVFSPEDETSRINLRSYRERGFDLFHETCETLFFGEIVPRMGEKDFNSLTHLEITGPDFVETD
jgi:hypothetical protein